MPFRPDQVWPVEDKDSKVFRDLLSKIDTKLSVEVKAGNGRSAFKPAVFTDDEFGAAINERVYREAIRAYHTQGWVVHKSIGAISLYDPMHHILFGGSP